VSFLRDAHRAVLTIIQLTDTSIIAVLSSITVSGNASDLTTTTPTPYTTLTPQQQVFGTVDLLEQILLCLPPQSIYTAQAVGSLWKELIRTSTQSRSVCSFG
jgi:hypothetical protein